MNTDKILTIPAEEYHREAPRRSPRRKRGLLPERQLPIQPSRHSVAQCEGEMLADFRQSSSELYCEVP